MRYRKLISSQPSFLLVTIAALFSYSSFSQQLAVGYGNLAYQLPPAGSYNIPKISQAQDGAVLDSQGQQRTLHELYQGKVNLLSFMYSSCSDINGCPLSSYVFYKIKTAMAESALLADNLRLISLSFDPEIDTPEVMALYANNFKYAGKEGEWEFLTTESLDKLTPILKSYDQDIQRQVNELSNAPSGEFSHLLKVFLIDEEANVRNIYSVNFLHTDLVINDVKTILLEDDLIPDNHQQAGMLSRPGDNREGYESSSYTTNSLSLENRKGSEVNLLRMAKAKAIGLPALPEPAHNLLTEEKIVLGKKLFFDRRLSINNTFSCAMCHVPEQGFTSNEISTAVGVEGRSVKRNAPTLYNVAHIKALFHDGREENLEQQVWGPLLARNEMANPSVGYVLSKIRNFPDYTNLFESAFNNKQAGMETVGQALASYQRALISANSPFDQWYYNKDLTAISEQAKQGFELFAGKANCTSCHSVNEKYALFTDNLLHNTGLGYKNSILTKDKPTRVTIAPGVTIDVDPELIKSVGEKPASDVGQYEVTEDPVDRWKYRTPTLRNIALTAPYMHNGEMGSLKEVVAFYNQGGVPHSLQTPLIRPLQLTEIDQQALVEFLLTLTGDNTDLLVSDAFSAPIGDPGFKSP